MSTITPLAVWDVHNRSWAHNWRPVMEYLESQGIPVDDTYRVEVYLLDMPFARVFTYAENERGWRYVDPATGDAAVNDPYDVLLTALPPDGLRLVLE